MAGVFIGQHDSRQVAHDLMHIHQNLSGFLPVKGNRFNARIDLRPLLCPVSADFLRATNKTTFERFGPGYIGRHSGKGGVYIARIKSGVGCVEGFNFGFR